MCIAALVQAKFKFCSLRTFKSFFNLFNIFDLWLVESTDVETVDVEGQPQRLSKDEDGGDKDHGRETMMGKMKP